MPKKERARSTHGHPVGRTAAVVVRPAWTWVVVTVLATAPLLQDCSPAGSPPEPPELQEPGVERVDNPAQPAWSGRDGPPMRFVLEQSFGAQNEPYEAILSPISGRIAVDGDGNLYVVVRGPRLLSFGPDGSLRWAVEHQGEGPGELRGASGVAAGGDRIYVGNAGATRIDVWTTEGEFVRSQVLNELGPSAGTPGGLVTPEIMVLRTSLRGELSGTIGQVLTLVDLGPPWSLRAEKTVDVNPRFELPEGRRIGVDFSTSPDGVIALGNVGTYELHFLDETAAVRRIVTVDTDRIVRPGVARIGGDVTVEEYGEVRAPLRLHSGHWLVHARWPVGLDDPDGHARLQALDQAPRLSWRHSLDLFDAEGRFLASMEDEGGRPGIGFPLTAGPDGRLYTLAVDPYLRIRRYRVEVLEPSGS